MLVAFELQCVAANTSKYDLASKYDLDRGSGAWILSKRTEGEARRTVLSFGLRQSRASGTDARSGRLSFAYLALAKQRKVGAARHERDFLRKNTVLYRERRNSIGC